MSENVKTDRTRTEVRFDMMGAVHESQVDLAIQKWTSLNLPSSNHLIYMNENVRQKMVMCDPTTL